MSDESFSFDALEVRQLGRQLGVITKRTLSSLNNILVKIVVVQEVFRHSESKSGLYFWAISVP